MIGDAVTALLASGAHSAVKYLEPSLVVRVTRKKIQHGKWNSRRTRFVPVGPPTLNGSGKRERRVEVVVTIGEPNADAREFIKRAKRAEEPFPVKKIQLKFLRTR